MPIYSLNKKLKKLRNRHFFVLDVFSLVFTPVISLFIRFDLRIGAVKFDRSLILILVLFLLTKLIFFKIGGLYRRYWKSASIDDLARIIFISIYTSLLIVVIYSILRLFDAWEIKDYPLSLPFIDSIITFIFIATPRLSIRLFSRVEQRLGHEFNDEQRTLIIGAGDAGILVLTEIQKNNMLNLFPIGFIDDDNQKQGLRIRGLEVFGGRELIETVVCNQNVKKIIIALPSVSGKIVKEILCICEKTKAQVLTVPGLFEIIDEKVSIQKFRKIEIEDLLRRESVNVDLISHKNLINNKSILVSGAGGSIGREICRQIIKYEPEKIILLGHGENSIFEIEQELKVYNKNKKISFCTIADVKDKNRLKKIFSTHRPEIVFHAAAHKHVPLMEENVSEAVINNVYGTRNILDIAIEYGIKGFVLISTDKAVNPTNIMGATKRIAEILILDRYLKTGLKLITVRFGNVLGSRGSVLHTFRRQIHSGGPITITHPDIERYFMTIPEAVQLVLQAFSIGVGGEVYVLDMGERVRIIDLAKDMIRLSGFNENEIPIQFTGLRPGEKLIEELFNTNEYVEKTDYNKIFKAKNGYSVKNDNDIIINEFINLAFEQKDEELKEKLFSFIEKCKE